MEGNLGVRALSLGWRRREKHREGDSQEAPLACPVPPAPSPGSQQRHSLGLGTGPLENPHGPRQRHGLPPTSLSIHFLGTPAPPLSVLSALSLLLCEVHPAELLATWGLPPRKLSEEPAPSGCRAHPHAPGGHHLGGWPVWRPGWLWLITLRPEASSPSGLCPSLRMWRRKEVALNARCRERGVSGHVPVLVPRLRGP